MVSRFTYLTFVLIRICGNMVVGITVYTVIRLYVYTVCRIDIHFLFNIALEKNDVFVTEIEEFVAALGVE